MVFAYYESLNVTQQRIYRQSDSVPSVAIENPERFFATIETVFEALRSEKKAALQRALTELNDGLVEAFGIREVGLRVLAKRPSKSWGELQGLYELADEDGPARITVWMRTAQKKQVVAFKTFLRTYLHEFVHHLDYEHLKLADSFHTKGFYSRESSLFKQLVPDPSRFIVGGEAVAKKSRKKPQRGRKKTPRTSSARSKKKGSELTQSSLPFDG